MKKILIFSVLLFFGTIKNSQSQVGIVETIESAFAKGDVAIIKKHSNSTIDLYVPGNEGTYSNVQAEQILKQFFFANPPKGYKRKQQGSSQGGSMFLIGILETGIAKNYRVYCLLKKTGSGYAIQQIQFEEE